MQWNMDDGRASVELSSLRDQEIRCVFPVSFRRVLIDGALCAEGGKEFTLSLKKDAVTTLTFEF